ncbi:MAG: hypothetical protein JO189_25540 [Deltaproteobacteria bacterium]|nr:hypothetical protein [Deltaproteobacteria bacterium]
MQLHQFSDGIDDTEARSYLLAASSSTLGDSAMAARLWGGERRGHVDVCQNIRRFAHPDYGYSFKYVKQRRKF